MERTEIIQYLRENGVCEKALGMPCVIEPIYEKYKDKKSFEGVEIRIKWGKRVYIKFDGITIEIDNPDAEWVNIKDDKEDTLTWVNEYGIETRKDWENLPKKEGQIASSKKFLGRHPDGSGITYHRYEGPSSQDLEHNCMLEMGYWNIEGALKDHRKVVFESLDRAKEVALEDVDWEKVLEIFDENAAEVIANYPNTKEWYDKARATIIEKMYKVKIKKLEEKNKELLESNQKIAKMLGKSLSFVEKVKLNPVGQIFFRKGLKEIDESVKNLDTSREEI